MYICTGVMLYIVKGIECTAVLFYSYIQHRELCVQVYRCNVSCSRGNCVYSCIVYCYIQHRELCVQLYRPNVVYSTGNRELCVQL